MDEQSAPTENDQAHIGTLNEKSLHAALKRYLAQAGDRFEVRVDGYVIDIVRGEQLIEIQTGSFSPLKRKLRRLTREHAVHLVYPIAAHKWIVKQTDDGARRRKSPKRGSVYDLFAELVYIPDLLERPNFTLEVLLIKQEDWRRFDPSRRRRRRRGWVTEERHLLEVEARHRLAAPAAVAGLLPADLAEPFTTRQLADAIGRPRRTAQQMAYCLRHLSLIEVVGHEGNARLYVRRPT